MGVRLAAVERGLRLIIKQGGAWKNERLGACWFALERLINAAVDWIGNRDT
jgi:hypothetical protein